MPEHWTLGKEVGMQTVAYVFQGAPITLAYGADVQGLVAFSCLCLESGSRRMLAKSMYEFRKSCTTAG